MEIKIEWSEVAERQLKDIFDYFSFVANKGIAGKIADRIVDRVSILGNNPKAGPREELLIDREEEFRYLVEGNYKIIYWMHGHIITIAAVFDCRQNPEKLKTI